MCDPKPRRSLVQQIFDTLTLIEQRLSAIHVMTERVVTGRAAIHTKEFEDKTDPNYTPDYVRKAQAAPRPNDNASSIEDAMARQAMPAPAPGGPSIISLVRAAEALGVENFVDVERAAKAINAYAEILDENRKLSANLGSKGPKPATMTKYVNLYRGLNPGGEIRVGTNIYSNPRYAAEQAMAFGIRRNGPYVATVPVEVPLRTF